MNIQKDFTQVSKEAVLMCKDTYLLLNDKIYTKN